MFGKMDPKHNLVFRQNSLAKFSFDRMNGLSLGAAGLNEWGPASSAVGESFCDSAGECDYCAGGTPGMRR